MAWEGNFIFKDKYGHNILKIISRYIKRTMDIHAREQFAWCTVGKKCKAFQFMYIFAMQEILRK